MSKAQQLAENLKSAIEEIEKTDRKVSNLLSGHQMLLANVKHVFKTLINNMKHLDTISDIEGGVGTEQKPLKKVLGISTAQKEKIVLPSITKNEAQAFRDMVDEVYEGFSARENRDIMESLTKTIILAVAKKAGLVVDEDREINSQYITHIKTAIKTKAGQQAVRDSAQKPNPKDTDGSADTDGAQAIENAVNVLRAGGTLGVKDLAKARGITEEDAHNIIKKAQLIYEAKPADEPAENNLVIEWIKNKVNIGDSVTVQGLVDHFKIAEDKATSLLNEANISIENS